jgi:Zn-dependent M16 (insulinase) family peptidase
MDNTTLDAAKSSIVYGVASNVSTVGRAVSTLQSFVDVSGVDTDNTKQAMNSFANQALKGVSQDFQVEMLSRYQNITKEQVLEALKKYFLPLFDPASSIAVVVTAPSKLDSVAEGLTESGFDVEKRSLEVDAPESEGSEAASNSDADGEDSKE